MSEQARVAYLEERIRDAKREERTGTIVLFFGVILAGFGFSVGSNFGLDGTWAEILGILVAAIGFYSLLYSQYKYVRLMQELGGMGSPNLKCPRCGKELPKGNYAFCPFCGASARLQTIPPP